MWAMCFVWFSDWGFEFVAGGCGFLFSWYLFLLFYFSWVWGWGWGVGSGGWCVGYVLSSVLGMGFSIVGLGVGVLICWCCGWVWCGCSSHATARIHQYNHRCPSTSAPINITNYDNRQHMPLQLAPINITNYDNRQQATAPSSQTTSRSPRKHAPYHIQTASRPLTDTLQTTAKPPPKHQQQQPTQHS